MVSRTGSTRATEVSIGKGVKRVTTHSFCFTMVPPSSIVGFCMLKLSHDQKKALEKIKDPLEKIVSIEGLNKHLESVKARFDS